MSLTSSMLLIEKKLSIFFIQGNKLSADAYSVE